MNSTYTEGGYSPAATEQTGNGVGRGRVFQVLAALAKPVLALAVILAVGLLLVAFPGRLASDGGAVLTLAVFWSLRLAADLFPIHSRRLRLAEGTVVVDFALLLLVGLGGATFVAGSAAAVRTLLEAARERRVHPLLVIARAVVVVGLAGLAYDLTTGHQLLPVGVEAVPAIVVAAVVYAACDLLLSAAGSLTSWEEARAAGLLRPGTIAGQYLGLFLASTVAAAVYSLSPFASVLLALPVGVAYYTLNSARSSRRSIREAIESLAAEIDEREAYTAEHSERCAFYARKICGALRLSSNDTDLIVGVARIHDLGKMNIWPEMLNKPGALDDDERLEMNRHPSFGAEILSSFVDLRHARDIILHHHERFDGRGYPAGLRGKEIPLGSRVVAVVDAFDAMTSHRPYRSALSFERAVAELVANAGKQFDPEVVEAFVSSVRPEDVPKSAGIRAAGRPQNVA